MLVQLSFVARGVKPKPVTRRRGWLLTVLVSPTLVLVETSTTILFRPNTAHRAIGIYPRCDSFDLMRFADKGGETRTRLSRGSAHKPTFNAPLRTFLEESNLPFSFGLLPNRAHASSGHGAVAL